MSNIEQQAKGKKDGEIRYLTPLNIDTNKQKKYCRFKKSGIKYVDYKDPDFLMKLVNEQGKLLPRRLTGTSLKYQRKVVFTICLNLLFLEKQLLLTNKNFAEMSA